MVRRNMAVIYRSDVPNVILNQDIAETSDCFIYEFNESLQSLDVGSYAYFFSSPGDKRPGVVTNLPGEWLLEYEEESLYQVDPVLNMSGNTTMPFSWQTRVLSGRKSKRLADNALKYKIFDGYTFVTIAHGNYVGVLTLCNQGNKNSLYKFNKKRAAFIQFALLSHHNSYLEKYRLAGDVCNYNLVASLSWREREVIYWVGRGKTYFESSVILGISERTIKFHMHNIKNKLEVCSVKQVVSIAAECGLLR